MNGGKESGIIHAGIDYREECPKVCCQTEQMTEPLALSLDFKGQSGHAACFRKILSALKHYGDKEQIRAAVILPGISGEEIRQYIREACEAGFQEKQLQIMSESESVVHFVMHQTNDIWQHQVWLLEFCGNEIKATAVRVNKRTMPMLIQVQKTQYWQIGSRSDGGRDGRLLEHVREHFGKEHVSAVFLTGTDLNVRDYKKSREEICFRRRAFLGDLIHARGACMASGERAGDRPYLFLGEQTLLFNMGIRSSREGKEEIHTIINAGCSWYEAEGSCEVLLLDEPLLEFTFSSMLGGEPVRAGMMLTDLPRRPGGTGRLLVEAHFTGPVQCEVKVTDLGFGEMYPSSDLYWKESFILEDQEEKRDGDGFCLQV